MSLDQRNPQALGELLLDLREDYEDWPLSQVADECSALLYRVSRTVVNSCTEERALYYIAELKARGEAGDQQAQLFYEQWCRTGTLHAGAY